MPIWWIRLRPNWKRIILIQVPKLPQAPWQGPWGSGLQQLRMLVWGQLISIALEKLRSGQPVRPDDVLCTTPQTGAKAPLARTPPGPLVWSYFNSVQFSCSFMSYSLWPHGLQHARLPCPSLTPRACWSSYPSSRWCHPTILSSVIPFSSSLQSFSASGSFPRSQFFPSGGQSIGVSASASVLTMNIQDWFPLG